MVSLSIKITHNHNALKLETHKTHTKKVFGVTLKFLDTSNQIFQPYVENNNFEWMGGIKP